MLGGGGVRARASRRACLLRAVLVAATWLAVCVGATPVSGAPIVSVYSSGLVVGGWPNVITAGRDGAMWFSQYSANRIGRITPDGTITEYPTSGSLTTGAHPSGIVAGPDGKKTLIIVTYDEFGGQWDHVSPPGTAGDRNPHDVFGPGTRVPALLISARIKRSGVDHDSYDTTSILATIERQFSVRSLRDPWGRPTRDAKVADLLQDVRR